MLLPQAGISVTATAYALPMLLRSMNVGAPTEEATRTKECRRAAGATALAAHDALLHLKNNYKSQDPRGKAICDAPKHTRGSYCLS
jgi:hypothetical protein